VPSVMIPNVQSRAQAVAIEDRSAREAGLDNRRLDYEQRRAQLQVRGAAAGPGAKQ